MLQKSIKEFLCLFFFLLIINVHIIFVIVGDENPLNEWETARWSCFKGSSILFDYVIIFEFDFNFLWVSDECRLNMWFFICNMHIYVYILCRYSYDVLNRHTHLLIPHVISPPSNFYTLTLTQVTKHIDEMINSREIIDICEKNYY